MSTPVAYHKTAPITDENAQVGSLTCGAVQQADRLMQLLTLLTLVTHTALVSGPHLTPGVTDVTSDLKQ